jgi:spermidine synthase
VAELVHAYGLGPYGATLGGSSPPGRTLQVNVAYIMEFFKNNMLFGVVFVTGACVLIIEIAAVRILSPYYGNTIFSVSSVITVILAALSIGYYIGGKWADKRPHLSLFYKIIFASGFTVLVLELVGAIVLPYLGYKLSLINGPLITSALLFFLPGLLLGTLSPFVITLQKIRAPEEGVGAISGKVFFWSTCGSIAGSLAAGFVLIPQFGVSEIMIGTGAALSVIGAAGMLANSAKKQSILVLSAIGAMLAGSFFAERTLAEKDLLYANDGVYERVIVFDAEYKGKPTRFLRQDWSSSSAMFLDSEEDVFEYTEYYKLYKVFGVDLKETLVIGAGAYTMPKALLAEGEDVQVDVVEIEGLLVDVGKQFFGVPDTPRLTDFVEDGRRFLHDTETQYDLIFADAYVSSVPAHLATKEFFELAKERLSPNGIFVANIIGDLRDQGDSFVLAEMKTWESVFPNSYFFAVYSPHEEYSQNMIFVGSKDGRKADLEELALAHPDNTFMQNLKDRRIDPNRFDLSQYEIFTDNFAPVEYFAAQAWKRRFESE